MSALDQALAVLRGHCACRGDDEFLDQAEAELGRLQQSEREGWRYANELEQERKRLREAVDLSLIALGMECTSPPILDHPTYETFDPAATCTVTTAPADETALAMKACRAVIAEPTITQDEIAQGVADRDAERAELRAEIMANLRLNGWRQCAVGQKTTQFCGLLEEAVKAEREASFLRGYAAAIRFARGA
jgi:hypothetical protein